MFIKKDFIDGVKRYIKVEFGKGPDKAENYEKFIAVSKAIMEHIIDDWNKTEEEYSKGKQAYYLSAEYMIGRAFGNNLLNLGIYNEVKEALKELNIDLNIIEETEEDAGLGNGGLGRLAACFLESGATLNLPITGYGIRYSNGFFKQKFINGYQVEEADDWLKYGDPWSIRRSDEAVIVEFADGKVKAVPYDIPIIGYGTRNINKLRLWKSEPVKEIDFNLFNSQEYDKAVKEKNRAENISRILYPNDTKDEGKVLRLKQQYFFVSASIKDLVRKFKIKYGNNFELFHEYHAIQLNDTHPVAAIPELMRILIDEEGLEWERAWQITIKTFSYTNHTILAEAMERWEIRFFKKLLPRIYEIIKEIDMKLVEDLKKRGYTRDRINRMKIISNNTINMAWLAIYGTHTVNGVAKLHTEILKTNALKDWYELYPERFKNVTNGVTQRRWLALCNKELTEFITELLGTKEWVVNLPKLKELEKYKDDEDVLNRFLNIKYEKKVQLAKYIKECEGIKINPDSIFDIQIKRLHEYKRQLLNGFHILDLYFRLKENPNLDIVPRTFIFGAKAAPGYARAKAIIKYINEIAKLINNDSEINEKIKVVFVQNYRVSYAEKLFPAADVSEQISTAGKEASGTGNMKFMLNGALTIGTYDGANIEIVEAAGEENNFIFGARVEELEEIKNNYDPKYYYENVTGLRKVIDTLIDGTFSDDGTGMFKELYDSLLRGAEWHPPDNYFILKEFEDYREAHGRVDTAYRDRLGWARKCWINLSNSGRFSSDRSIKDYAGEIWNIKTKKI